MSTVCGRPQGGEGGPANVDRGEGQKRDFFVDVINGWSLMRLIVVLIISLQDYTVYAYFIKAVRYTGKADL